MNTEPTPGPHAGMYPTVNRKPRRWPWIVGTVVAFFVGIGAGAASGDEATPVADVEPEVVTETVTETVVETETLEVTPAVCIDALDEASEMFYATADVMDVILDWHDDMTTILDRDGYLITAEWNELDTKYAPLLTEAMAPVDGSSTNAAQCRELAGH